MVVVIVGMGLSVQKLFQGLKWKNWRKERLKMCLSVTVFLVFNDLFVSFLKFTPSEPQLEPIGRYCLTAPTPFRGNSLIMGM